MKFTVAACHIGQAKALRAVTDRLTNQRHGVTVLLDGPAVEAHLRGDLEFSGCDVHVVSSLNQVRSLARSSDKALVMLSPAQNHLTVEGALYTAASSERRVVYGYAEVPCGHLAPIWKEALPFFSTLFVAQRTLDLADFQNAREVGVDVPTINVERARATKAKLGIGKNDPFIWYSGGPYSMAGTILKELMWQVADLRKTYHLNVVVVFSRHGRDKKDKSSREEYLGACKLSYDFDVRMVENSLDHMSDETTELQRSDLVPYVNLLEACSLNGIAVTGHGTDGMVKAPRLGIPSVLCVGSELNPDILQEKSCEILPLPPDCPRQVTSLGQLAHAIRQSFFERANYQARCMQIYRPQLKPASQVVADHMTAE